MNKVRVLITASDDEAEGGGDDGHQAGAEGGPRTRDAGSGRGNLPRDSSPSAAEGGGKEEKETEGRQGGGNLDGAGRGAAAGPPARATPEAAAAAAAAAATKAAAAAAHEDKNPAGGMNRHLWRLEENGLVEGCDTSKPPSKANQPPRSEGRTLSSRDSLTKILTTRHVFDRSSLLEYTASVGKDRHLLDLSLWLRWKVGVGGLVSQLREPRAGDGAPLLFQAVTTEACFLAATQVISSTLGVGGLTQQVRAKDKRGRTLLMHAARYARHPGVLPSALELVADLTDEEHRLLGEKDKDDRNLLHHAAAGVAEGTLRKAIQAVAKVETAQAEDGKGETKPSIKKLSTQRDRRGGRTPALCALRRRWTSMETLRDNLRLLGWEKEKGRMGWEKEELGERKCSDLDLFLHAARGGHEAFEFAREFKASSGSVQEAGQSWFLPALDRPPDPGEETADFEKIFAQAALSGDPRVLEALKNCVCGQEDPTSKGGQEPPSSKTSKEAATEWAVKSDYPLDESDFLRAAARARAPSIHSLADELGVSDSDAVGEATACRARGSPSDPTIKRDSKASLFTLAILSGSPAAVEWVAEFVTASLEEDKTKVWEALHGKSGEERPSSLTYSAVASGFHKVGGMFDVVCDKLRGPAREAKNGDGEAADGLFREALVGESSRKGRYTPLVAAVSSGNPAMLDKIREAYERGAGEPCGEKERGNVAGGSFPLAPVARFLIDQFKEVLKMKDSSRTPEEALMWRSCNVRGSLKNLRQLDAGAEKAVWEKSVAEVSREWHDLVLRKVTTEAWRGGTPAMDVIRDLLEKGFFKYNNQEKLPTTIAQIVATIGDDEDGVTDIVLCAIRNSINPFVTSAIASNAILERRRSYPRDHHRLDNLQERIDAFTAEVLDKLPQSVRRVGLELIGSFEQPDECGEGNYGDDAAERAQAVLANLVGYIAVVSKIGWAGKPASDE